ncbi:hypothetical protein D9758_010113 [Tetrapyrgos nigripes]|uniref:Carboxylesterase type B domain-containing protein n=1 Tax=Tetrapyrgos nigripes TaxID=182062 RepID=A0A8H5FSA9_9AGAR|nr:hypothetical protein D9758_010113 [Tetrapyrgos nigripes]
MTLSTALEPTSTSNLTLNTFNAVANLTGCDTFGNPQGSKTLACLRNLPMGTLLNITIQQHDSTSSQNDGDVYLPTVDGDFLPSASSELTRQGRFVRMPVIIGWTEDDGTLFTPANTTMEEFLHIFYPDLTQTTISRLLELYPVEDFNANTEAGLSAEFYRTAQVFRDILLVCPSFLFGHAMADKYSQDLADADEHPEWRGGPKTGAIPVFLYSFNQTILTPSLESLGSPGLGVIHSSELAYVYASFTAYNTTGLVNPTEADYALLEQVSRSWTTFASVGLPTIPGKVTLKGWEGSYHPDVGMMDAGVYVVGGSDPGVSKLEGKGSNKVLVAQKLKERCGFLNSDAVIEQLKY